MSNGTLQQLGCLGVQDGHLCISPETSFFKRTYKRVSNYAIESIDQSIPSLVWDKEIVTMISRNGDLLSELWLTLDLNLAELADDNDGADTVHWTNVLGHAMLKAATLEIGNNEVDRTTGLHMEIKWELESDVNRDTNELVLRSFSPQQLINWTANGNTLDLEGNRMTSLYVKLPFYFTKARSQALPVIALQYHDIRIRVSLRSKNDLLVFSNPQNTALHSTNNGDIKNSSLMANFVYLDSMERRLFAANSHEFLIRNMQISDYHAKAPGASRINAQVVFNHPTTVVFWVVQKKDNIAAKDYFNFELTKGHGDDTITSATIKFNGSERERARGPLYWRAITSDLYYHRTPRRNIYMYSFAQYPSAWWPSGSVNLSRIDQTALEFTCPRTDANGETFGEATISIIVENHNVGRVQGGMYAKKYAT